MKIHVRTRSLTAIALSGMIILAGCSDDSPTDPTPPAAAEVVLDPDAITLTAIGETRSISAVVFDEEGEEMPDAEVEWSSSDEAVATVSSDGVVTAVSTGTATITAEAGDASATAEVTVTQEPAELVVSPASVTFETIGETETLTAMMHDAEGNEIEGYEFTWSSSDEEVATVDSNGTVAAVGEGTATITAESGDFSGTAEITVDLDA